MAQRTFVKSLCLVMTLLGQQTQKHRNKAGVLTCNTVLTNIFATVCVTKGLHKQCFVHDNSTKKLACQLFGKNIYHIKIG